MHLCIYKYIIMRVYSVWLDITSVPEMSGSVEWPLWVPAALWAPLGETGPGQEAWISFESAESELNQVKTIPSIAHYNNRSWSQKYSRSTLYITDNCNRMLTEIFQSSLFEGSCDGPFIFLQKRATPPLNNFLLQPRSNLQVGLWS